MAEQKVYDVAIIGLGPAGATLARLLSNKLKVVAIDKKSSESGKGFNKPCGGLLAPDAQRAISKFGLTLPKDILVSPQIFAVKTIDLKQKLLRHYQRFYINLDRNKFDAWLISLIPSHVEIIAEAFCASIEKSDGIYTVCCKKDNDLLSIKAKYVVGADGANSIVRRRLFPEHKIRRYVAIQQWFTDVNPKPFYSSLFDHRITDCYGWSISKDGYFIVGGAFPCKSAKKRFKRLKGEITRWGFVFGMPVKTESCVVLRPNGFFSVCTGKNGAFLLGEAAGFISPSSLEGISYAFNSAIELAKIFNTYSKNLNSKYNIKTAKIRIRIAFKNIKSIFIYIPFLRKIIMKSGMQSIDVAEDS